MSEAPQLAEHFAARASRLVGRVARVVQAPNDKQQIAPMLEKVDALLEQLGRPETLWPTRAISARRM
jgi:hypothetical protein